MAVLINVDDDHFDYEGGMKQCISGFGRNAEEAVEELLNHRYSDAAHNRVNWHIRELVRWCRGLNRELKVKERELEAVSGELIGCGCGYDLDTIAEILKGTGTSDS